MKNNPIPPTTPLPAPLTAHLAQLPPDTRAATQQLITTYPQFTFRPGPRFSYKPPHTITLGPPEPHYLLLFLHELGHATLGHASYNTMVARLKLERAAWDQAERLAKKHHIPWDSDFVETQLDTYRNWLHTKTRCPKCGLSRYQSPDGALHCPHCDTFCTPG